MIARTSLLFLTLTLSLCAAAQNQNRSARKSPSPQEPINIELGGDSPSRPRSTPASSAAGARTSPGSASTTTAELGAAVSDMYGAKIGRVRPIVNQWKDAASQIQASGGITPNFASERQLNERIAVFQDARDESRNVTQAINQNFARFESELGRAGVPADQVKTGAGVLLKEVQTVAARAKVVESMSTTALDILNLLNAQWGNWKIANGTLDFDIDFKTEDKIRYGSLVQKYQEDSAALQQLGGIK